MAASNFSAQLHDIFLQSMLKTSASLRDHTFALLDLIERKDAESPNNDDSPAPHSNPDILISQQRLAAQLSALRGQNRRLAHLVRDTKATTGTSRAEVDRLHLSLQNLYYEQRHLLGEIASCENSAHPYAELPLTPEEEFLRKYPDWERRRIEAGDEDGEAGFMKARIAEEKRERQELEGKRLELVKRKLELVKENAKRKEELGKLDRDLEAFIKAAKPIQVTFEKGAPSS